MSGSTPLVSVLLTTRDRPRFLPIALACYRHQTYSNRELLVVDDGESHPADPSAVAAAGGRLIQVPLGASIGLKLNRGAVEARGILCQNFDDDDWYGPRFLETMVSGWLAARAELCRPTVAALSPFALFDLVRWDVRSSGRQNDWAGGTILFAREDALACPFRDMSLGIDRRFVEDQCTEGAVLRYVEGLDEYLHVRHRGVPSEHGHTWTEWGGQPVEERLRTPASRQMAPDRILPAWAQAAYQEMRRSALTQMPSPGTAPAPTAS